MLHRVSKWDAAGNAQGWIGGGSNGWQTGNGATSGTGYQSFSTPIGVFVDGSGNIYVAESSNQRISKWNAAGTAQGWIGGGNTGWQTTAAPASGTGHQWFNGPLGVCVDGSGTIFVADLLNHRISKWTAAGSGVGWFGGAADGWQTGACPGAAADYRSFNLPSSVFVLSGSFYVADDNNNRVCKWTN
jgi:hypothetical protein